MESRFSLELNSAKNSDFYKKCFKQKLFRMKFLTRTSGTHNSTFPKSGSRGFRILLFLKYYNALEWKSKSSVGLNAAKNTDFMKKIL